MNSPGHSDADVREHATAAGSRSRQTIAINGRFLSQDVTGVQRFAHEFIRALDAHPTVHRDARWLLIAPRGVRAPRLRNVEVRQMGRLRGHAWEQIELPLFTRSLFLVNLTGNAPVMKARQLVVIHDTSVYSVGRSFSLRYRVLQRSMLPVIARRSALVATVSNFSAGEIARLCGRRLEQIVVAYNGAEHILRVAADSQILERHGLRKGAFVMFVGAGQTRKNLRGLAQALSQSALPIVTVGKPPRTARRDPMNMPGLVNLGRVTDGELRALYEAAACLAYPSTYEGFGLPPVEAMAVGCPVVVSNIGALREVCGPAAVYCDPTDVDSIQFAIQLASEPTRRAELAALGRARARSYNWAACVERILTAVDLA